MSSGVVKTTLVEICPIKLEHADLFTGKSMLLFIEYRAWTLTDESGDVLVYVKGGGERLLWVSL